MTTQMKDSNAEQVTQEYVVKPRFNWPLITIATLIVALIAGFVIVGLPAEENQTNVQRANEADAARYSGLAAHYLAENETNRQQAIEAEAARYNGLANFYLTENKSSVQRAFEADAARYSGLAAYHLKKDEANRQRAIEAEAARYNGLAEFFMAGK